MQSTHLSLGWKRAGVWSCCVVGDTWASRPSYGGQGSRCVQFSASGSLLQSCERTFFPLIWCGSHSSVQPPTQILEATTTIRDALVARVEPVYGLTTMHASLRLFIAQPVPSHCPAPDAKTSSYAFGLIALGKFILRLPAEILEDELPRLKLTLTTVRTPI